MRIPGWGPESIGEQVVTLPESPSLPGLSSEEWPFEDGVARPIERLQSGGLDEVLSAAPGFGATFT